MGRARPVILAVAILAFAGSPTAKAADYGMKPYPPPEPGMVRMAFDLPALDNEDDYRVEIEVGKLMPVDCNRMMLPGKFDAGTAEGWGFTYYIVRPSGPPATTLMACPPGSAPVESFVPVSGAGHLVRYNSKLPVVVYVPEGFTARYRTWSAETGFRDAEPR